MYMLALKCFRLYTEFPPPDWDQIRIEEGAHALNIYLTRVGSHNLGLNISWAVIKGSYDRRPRVS